MEIILLIAIVGMLFHLHGRVKRLEQAVWQGEREPFPAEASRSEGALAGAQDMPPLPPPPSPSAAPQEQYPSWFATFVAWLKEDWLLKLGALLLLIGFGWLTTYAFLNNWIGPMGRIALGIIAGAFFLALGWWRMKAFVNQGSVFLVLGSTTVLLTIFAAREIYEFFTPAAALLVMFLSTAFAAFVSVVYKYKPLAVASLVLAAAAPLLTNPPEPNYAGLFAYLFIVVLGTLWIVMLTGQRDLSGVALLIVAAYSAPHLFDAVSADTGALLLFAYGFASVFFVFTLLGIVKLKGKAALADIAVAAGNGLLLLAWIMEGAPVEWQGLIIAAWMVVFAAGGFVAFRITGDVKPFYMYAGVATAMLAAATAAELDGAALTIAYTVESGAIALIAYAFLRDIRIAHRASLLLSGPVVLSLESIFSPAWRRGVLHEDFFVLFVLAVVLFGLGAFFRRQLPEGEAEAYVESRQTNAALLVLGSLYVYVLVWLSLHAALRDDDIAVMLSLLFYTGVGLAAYFVGQVRAQRGVRIYGAALLGFVVGRLLFVDVWTMDQPRRIATFFIIGALLASTAFWRKRKHSASKEALQDTQLQDE